MYVKLGRLYAFADKHSPFTLHITYSVLTVLKVTVLPGLTKSPRCSIENKSTSTVLYNLYRVLDLDLVSSEGVRCARAKLRDCSERLNPT